MFSFNSCATEIETCNSALTRSAPARDIGSTAFNTWKVDNSPSQAIRDCLKHSRNIAAGDNGVTQVCYLVVRTCWRVIVATLH